MIYYLWASGGKEVTTTSKHPPTKYAELLTTYYSSPVQVLKSEARAIPPYEPQTSPMRHGKDEWDAYVRLVYRG